MRSLLLVATAALCFAGTESRVSQQSIVAVEQSINEQFHANSPDPYDLLGTARGTYLEGYGALFTVEIQLVYVSPPTPFRPKIPPAEIALIRERKLKKIPELRKTMQTLLANASSTLEGLQPGEHVAIETIIWIYSWENSAGLPHRIFMSAEKQKLRDARAGGVDLASVIQEQDR